MTPVKVYPKFQRLLIVLVGLVFLLIALMGVTQGPLGARVFYAVILLFAMGWVYQGARIGVVIGPDGIVERSMGRPHRIPWSKVAEVLVAGSSGPAPGVTMIVLRLNDGSHIPLRATARYRKTNVEDIERRVNAFHSTATDTTARH